MGKSTLSLRVISQWRKEVKPMPHAVVFEGGGSFPATGRDGRRLSFVRRHTTPEALREHYAREYRDGRDPRREIHVIAGAGEWDSKTDRGGGIEAARCAAEFAHASGAPALIWWDEINVVDGACSGYSFSRWLRSGIGNRRHLRLAFGYSSQSPAWPHRHLRRLTNELYTLRVTDEIDLDLLRGMGVPTSDLAKIAALPPFSFFHYPRR